MGGVAALVAEGRRNVWRDGGVVGRGEAVENVGSWGLLQGIDVLERRGEEMECAQVW